MNSENITSKNIEQGLPKVLFCFAFRAHVIVMLNLSLSLAGWELNQMMKTTVMVLGIIGNLSRYVRTFFGETRRRRDMHVTVAVRSIPADITINRCHPKVLVVRPYVYKFAFRFRPTVGWGSTSTLPFSTFILCRKHRCSYVRTMQQRQPYEQICMEFISTTPISYPSVRCERRHMYWNIH